MAGNRTVLYIGETQSAVKAMPNPYKLEYGLMDISGEDAGRAMDANCTMYKQRLTQKRKLNLGWRNPDHSVVSTVLKAVNPEYFYVRYWDAMDDQWEVRQFYVGDRSAPWRWYWESGVRYEELSFDLIEV